MDLAGKLDICWWMLSKFGDWDIRLFWFGWVGCCKEIIRGDVAGDIEEGTDDDAIEDDNDIDDEANWWFVGIIDEDLR